MTRDRSLLEGVMVTLAAETAAGLFIWALIDSHTAGDLIAAATIVGLCLLVRHVWRQQNADELEQLNGCTRDERGAETVRLTRVPYDWQREERTDGAR